MMKRLNREIMQPINAMLQEIEAMYPNWKKFRDLAEAIRWHTTAQNKVIANLREENEMLRNNGERLWDGVTDLLDDSSIKKIERLYKNELSRFI